MVILARTRNSIATQCRVCQGESHQSLFVARSHYSSLSLQEYIVQRCCGCGLIFLSPDPPAEDLERLYGSADYCGDLYDNECWRTWAATGHLIPLLTQIEQRHGVGKILDVGCAGGFFLGLAKARGWDAYGVELNPETAKAARERYGVEVQTSSVHRMDWPSSFFDCVRMGHVLEHLVDPLGALEEARRVLKPGGILNIGVPNLDPHVERLVGHLPNRWLVSKIDSVLGWIDPPHHVRTWSEATLQRALAKYEFEVIWVRRTSDVVPRLPGFGRPWLYSRLAAIPLWVLRSGMMIEVLARRA